MLLFSGCGMFRKVFKSKEYSKLETKSEIRKDSTGLIIDKSVTTIKEKLDTVITVPGQIVRQDTYLNMDSLINGMTAVQNDLIDVQLKLNPITGILSSVAFIKPQKVPIKIDKETVIQNDITQQSYQSDLWKDSLNQISGSVVIEKKPVNFWWFCAGFGILLIIVVVFNYLWKNKKP